MAVAGGLVFAAIVGWLHVRRHDIDPATQGVSHYALGPTHAPMTVAFVALALGLVGAAATMGAVSGGASAPSTGIGLLWSAALGIAVVAIVPIPGPNAAPWRAPVHVIGALLFFTSAAAGAVVASAHVGRAVVGTAWLLATAVGLFLAGMAHAPGLFAVRGWLQRTCFALVVAWLVLVGWHLGVAG